MCGIAGWVAFERDLTLEVPAAEAMARTMACRGPDAEGVWTSRHAALGHRRLSIIDLEGGAQPMTAQVPGGEVCLVFSGEVYNFTELRAELENLGERFRTASDTEVVLRGYLRWGDGVAERLNGMFALAIWDTREDRLVLIRDRLGVKPLYVYPTRDGLLFGSEPKAILAHPEAERVVDADGLREWLAFVMTPRHAIWHGMRQVEPATVVTVDARGTRERVFWRLETRPHPDDLDSTIARVGELLDDTVRRQLVSDVPRCVLLSGGLDSSTLTVLAAGHLGTERVPTFSVDFAGQADGFLPDDLRGTPDAPFVRAVADHVGADHRDIVLDHAALADPDVRRATLVARDLPVGFGEMDFSLYLLFKAINEHSTVALSGESADEVFGGYRQFHDERIRWAHEFPWIAINAGPLDRDAAWLDPGVRAALDLDGYRRGGYADAVRGVSRLDGESDLEHRMRIMSHLHLTRFLRFLLERKDRLSMAAGLEVRVPFCDHRLVEYVYNAPWSMKNHDGREKSLLRSAIRAKLPAAVAERVKSAYPSTQDTFYVKALQEQARELLRRPGHAVFALADRRRLQAATAQEPAAVDKLARLGMERVLDVALWLDIYRPDVRLP
ncbi:asparagine synthase (glutamine-hydrolyzing) [Nonomuraea sp. NPDC050540]|uniref:asparagine synthase (glutamine-hydrolyzing) n=1 Tax=Nonomuraea sp. NPDC050540 TaxID=3364367 RepID=UPI00378D7E69